MDRLQILDYFIILASLLLSSGAGIYYGVVKKKNDSIEEYFLASREMSVLKTACSVFATVVSSGAMVGMVAEIYVYGTQLMVSFLSYAVGLYVAIKLFFPVFYRIGSHDLYKFYEIKFNKSIRYFLSIMTIIEKTLANSIVIYATATVLTTVTSINLWIIIITFTSVCVLYSAMGGVRGVTLADTIQAFVMVASVLVVIVMGVIHVGGTTIILERNWNSGRIEFFNFDIDPSARQTFWTASVGMLIISICSVSTSPVTVLRMMTSTSYKNCEKAAYYGTFLTICVSALCCYIGLLTYGLYYDCDPISSGIIKSPNQLIPLFISDIVSGYNGLAGMFYAGLICAAISTLSSNLNGLSALAMETFAKLFKIDADGVNYTRAAKISVLLIGLISVSGTVLVQKFPNVYQATMVLSFSNGPHFTLFLIGVLFPQAHLKSSVGSFVTGLIFMLWLLIGNVFVKTKTPPKYLTTVGCVVDNSTSLFSNFSAASNFTSSPAPFTFTPLNETVAIVSKVETKSDFWTTYFPLSSASFAWFSVMGVVVTLAAFIVLTVIFGPDSRQKVDVMLIPKPIQKLHKWFSRKWRRILLCDIYTDEESPSLDMTPAAAKLLAEHCVTEEESNEPSTLVQ